MNAEITMHRNGKERKRKRKKKQQPDASVYELFYFVFCPVHILKFKRDSQPKRRKKTSFVRLFALFADDRC